MGTFLWKISRKHFSFRCVFHCKLRVHFVTMGWWVCSGDLWRESLFSLYYILLFFLICFQPFLPPFLPSVHFLFCSLSGEEDILICLFRTKDSRILTGLYFSNRFAFSESWEYAPMTSTSWSKSQLGLLPWGRLIISSLIIWLGK